VAPRADEELSRESFNGYLRGLGFEDIHWTPFPNGETVPPDFTLRLDSDAYSVEITSLFTRYALPDGSSLPEESVWMGVKRLADKAEREARQLGTLSGGYVLTVDGPYDNFTRSRREIKKRLLEFIAATRLDPNTRDELCFDKLCFEVASCGQRFAITKWRSSQDWVAAEMLSDGGGWDWEVVGELQGLVEAAVASKARKLRNVPKPWILLLLDRHHFNRLEDYEELRGRLGPAWGRGSAEGEFHSIYLIQADGAVFPLKPGESGF
jgi:hypothetical protein